MVGVGSVGTEAFIALLIGARGDDPLCLQLKEATDSVLARDTQPGLFKHQGKRVVFGQRLMQAASDTFLGWTRTTRPADGKRVDFYVRQLSDGKGSSPVADMDERRLRSDADVCAEALARAHARSGSANGIGGYLGKGTAFDEGIAGFAAAYASQNELDYQAFAAAAESGQIEATPDV